MRLHSRLPSQVSSLLLAALLPSPFSLLPASAAEHQLTKREAYELYLTLAAVEGVGPDNTVKAADNLLALRPHVEAHEARVKALQRAADRAKLAARKDPALAATIDERLLAYVEQIETEETTTLTVTLPDLTLTPDEIAAAKLRPAHLAVLKRLEPKKAKPAEPAEPAGKTP